MQHARSTNFLVLALLASACAPQPVSREVAEVDAGAPPARDGAVAPLTPPRPAVAPPSAPLDARPADTAPPAGRDAASRPPDTARPPDASPVSIDPPVRPPDARVEIPPAPTALLVVGVLNPLPTDDGQLKVRLEGNGLTVKLGQDSGPATQADGVDLVVISGSSAGAMVAGKFTTIAVPVVCLEPVVLAPMRLTAAGDNGHGNATGNQITITAAEHPIAAGQSGTIAVTAGAANFGWGLPAESATRIAQVAGMANRYAVFAYERGAMLVGAPATPAPARRVALFVHSLVADRLTPAGWQIFDAAVSWALGR
jgi:hypothetical protein